MNKRVREAAQAVALIGAEHVAAGIVLEPELLARVDAVLGDVVENDPANVESFLERP